MIECELYMEDKSVCLKMNGHAGYGAEGSDIVCSAASILCHTFAVCIASIPGMSVKKSVMEKGHVHISATATGGEVSEHMENLMNFMSVGFGLLEVGYPKNVRLKKFKKISKVS